MRVTLIVLWVLGSVALAIGVCMLLDGCAPERPSCGETSHAAGAYTLTWTRLSGTCGTTAQPDPWNFVGIEDRSPEQGTACSRTIRWEAVGVEETGSLDWLDESYAEGRIQVHRPMAGGPCDGVYDVTVERNVP